MNDSCMCATRPICMCDMPHFLGTGLVHVCDMTHSLEIWLIHICDRTHLLETWLIRMCDRTGSLETWHMHMCDKAHILKTWLIHMCDMPHSHMLHVSSLTLQQVTNSIRVGTHCNALQHTAPCAPHCNKLSTLQHNATHCNTLQHNATQWLIADFTTGHEFYQGWHPRRVSPCMWCSVF